MGGIPSTGTLGKVIWPEGPGRRFEYGFEEGDEITPFYDPMIAKVIVWDETRIRCIQKIKKVLRDSVVFGVETNIPYLLEILSHPEFVQGKMTTRFIENHFSQALPLPPLSEGEKNFAELAMKTLRSSSADTNTGGELMNSPWQQSWRGI